MKKILFWDQKETTKKVEQALQSEKIVAITTDTVFGLSACLNEAGFEALSKIKKRNKKSILILIETIEKIGHLALVPYSRQIEKLMKKCWPGPVTLIFKAKVETPFYLAPEGTIALRIPAHEHLRELLSHFNGLFSTSANLHGEPVPERLEEVNRHIINQVEYVILDHEGQRFPTKPSTILDCTRQEIVVIREGAFAVSELEKIYGKPFKKN